MRSKQKYEGKEKLMQSRFVRIYFATNYDFVFFRLRKVLKGETLSALIQRSK